MGPLFCRAHDHAKGNCYYILCNLTDSTSCGCIGWQLSQQLLQSPSRIEVILLPTNIASQFIHCGDSFSACCWGSISSASSSSSWRRSLVCPISLSSILLIIGDSFEFYNELLRVLLVASTAPFYFFGSGHVCRGDGLVPAESIIILREMP